jgi:hypothetical protein
MKFQSPWWRAFRNIHMRVQRLKLPGLVPCQSRANVTWLLWFYSTLFLEVFQDEQIGIFRSTLALYLRVAAAGLCPRTIVGKKWIVPEKQSKVRCLHGMNLRAWHGQPKAGHCPRRRDHMQKASVRLPLYVLVLRRKQNWSAQEIRYILESSNELTVMSHMDQGNERTIEPVSAVGYHGSQSAVVYMAQ